MQEVVLLSNQKNEKRTKYILTLTPEQESIIERACEFYSRIIMGQFSEITWEIFCHSSQGDETYWNRRDQFDKVMSSAYRIAYPNGPHELDKYESERRGVAWNTYQSLRFVRSWHDHPEGGLTVNFNEPFDIDGCGIPKCEVVDMD